LLADTLRTTKGSTNAAYFMHINSLGSTSQATDYRGATAQDQLYYPWGQEWNTVGNAQEKRFARLGHRDTTEIGLDPTHFRMFSSTQGRWLSRDPRPGCIQHPPKPESLLVRAQQSTKLILIPLPSLYRRAE